VWDATVREVCCRPFQHVGGGDALLVGLDLGVGQAGVVVDDDMDVVEVETDPVVARSVVAGALAGVGASAAAVGDAAEFLYVHVDELARALPFVADSGGPGGSAPAGRPRPPLPAPGRS